MFRHAFSTMVHWLGDGSQFGSYYASVQKGNCNGCPNCQCGEGPNLDEARRDFRAMLNSKIRA
jgi:hypothetical protein